MTENDICPCREDYVLPGYKCCGVCRSKRLRYKERQKLKIPRKQKNVIDEWLIVCEVCPLEECVRPEGMYGLWTVRNYTRDHLLWKCPIIQAQDENITPEEKVCELKIKMVNLFLWNFLLKGIEIEH